MEARGWVHLSGVLHEDSEGGLGTSFSGGTRGRRRWEWMEGEPLLAGRQYKLKKKKEKKGGCLKHPSDSDISLVCQLKSFVKASKF